MEPSSPTIKRMTSGSVLRVLNLFAQILVALIIMPFVVKSLGDRMYGLWTVVGALIGYYGVLDFGLASAVGRHLAVAIGGVDEEECNKICNSALLIYTFVGFLALLITIVIVFLSPLLAKNPEDISLFSKVILILGISMAIDFPMRVFGGILTAKLRFDIMSFVQIMSLILRTILILIVLNAGYKILALAVVTFVSGIPQKILYIYFSKKNLPFVQFSSKYFKYDTIRTLFSYSIFTFIAQIGDQLRFYLDAIVISAYIGLAAVTHYKIASYLALQFISLIVAITGVMQPLFSQFYGEKNYDKIKKAFFLSTKISICVSSFVGFGLIAWGKAFIERWMGPSYLDAYPCLVILVAGCVLALWQSPSVSLLYGISKHRFFALFNIIEGSANLILSLLLVKPFGIIGVALGTFIPMAITKLIIQPIYVCRVASFEYREYVWKMGHTLLIVILSLVIPIFLTVRFIESKYLILFILGFVSTFMFSISIWLFNFSHDESQMLKKGLLPNKMQ